MTGPSALRDAGAARAEQKLDACLKIVRTGGISELQQVLGKRIPPAVFYLALRRLAGPRRPLTVSQATEAADVEEARADLNALLRGGGR